jgi:hypothetical protein
MEVSITAREIDPEPEIDSEPWIFEFPVEDYSTAWLCRAAACLSEEDFEQFINSGGEPTHSLD